MVATILKYHATPKSAHIHILQITWWHFAVDVASKTYIINISRRFVTRRVDCNFLCVDSVMLLNLLC